ncbi:MAG: hypothetical protein ACOH2V_12890 [Candidatus Saccharimonadaceae bacterium]
MGRFLSIYFLRIFDRLARLYLKLARLFIKWLGGIINIENQIFSRKFIKDNNSIEDENKFKIRIEKTWRGLSRGLRI